MENNNNNNNESEALKTVKLFMVNDWELEEDNKTHYIIIRKKKQSIVAHIVFFIFTLGLGNLIYYSICKLSPDRKKIFK